MKTKNLILFSAVAAFAFLSCNESGNKNTTVRDTTTTNATLNNAVDTASFYIGYFYGKNLENNKFENPNLQAMVAGINSALNGEDAPADETQMNQFLFQFTQKMMNEKGERALEEGKKFLESNAKKKGVQTTNSGLQYKIETEGSGPTPTATDVVKVHYRGTLIDGKEFDSSYKRNAPAEFPVNGVIAGWTEGLQLMPVGSKWTLYIPSDLAYGAQGTRGLIGPNEALIFEVELLEIVNNN